MTALVEVLLSTFNGGDHLRAQIDSVLAQDHPNLVLTVRDDGSTDATADVLREYAGDPRVRWSQGANLGLPGAFFALLDAADPAADFVALCDQDDVWLPGKLSRGAAALTAIQTPALYCARVLLVDQDLRPLSAHPLPRKGASLENALVQNIATGCTILLNRPAVQAVQGRWPDGVPIHDWWLYLVLSAIGTVVYDPEIVVHYRQHPHNVIGVAPTRWERLARRIRQQLRTGGGQPSAQVEELRRLYSELLDEHRRGVVDDFLDSRRTLAARLRYALTGAAFRQSRLDDAALKLLYALGRV